MAVLTAAYEDNRQDGDIIYYDILAAQTIYKGAIVVTQNANGYLVNATDATGINLAGIAVENSVAVAGESNGDRGIRVFLNGVFQLPCTGATQGWVGQQVYALDNNTVALRHSTTNYLLVGCVVGFVSSTKVKVAICCPCQTGWLEESWSSSSSSSSSFSSSSSSFSSSSSSEST